jgi:RNA polymerase sigma factor (sigma-70 family)
METIGRMMRRGARRSLFSTLGFGDGLRRDSTPVSARVIDAVVARLYKCFRSIRLARRILFATVRSLSACTYSSSTRKDSQHHDRHLLDCGGRRCLCLHLRRTRKTCTMTRPASSWPTEQVVSAAQRGDPHAIATLVCDSHTNVRRFARMLCPTPEDAEDAAQEALIVLYRRIGTLRATAALASWMFQIVRNECIRRARVTSRSPILATPVEPSAEDVALVRLEIERIVELISGLPAEQRAVLVLRDVQGLSGAATAHALGLSRPAMKSRLHRGRKTLRSQLTAARVAPSHQRRR